MDVNVVDGWVECWTQGLAATCESSIVETVYYWCVDFQRAFHVTLRAFSRRLFLDFSGCMTNLIGCDGPGFLVMV